MWGLALFLVETPVPETRQLMNYAGRDAILRDAANRFGLAFGPVADVLLRFPPLADDLVLQALARGAPAPTEQELYDLRQASKAKPKRKR
jgi:hypothetical protein